MSEPRRLRLTLEFDGTGFKGWQRQANGERTVQAEIEAAFARLPGVHGTVNAAGRTDAGVHALAMVAHCDTTSSIPDERLRLALNAHLPKDVVVLALETAEPGFEAQFHCQYRRYLYRLRVVRDDPRRLAIDRHRVLPVFSRLDLEGMRAATRFLLGRHDFAAFATQETRTTSREMYLCDLREEVGELRLHVAADGFLRNMVRTVVGTLLWVGKGRLSADDVMGVLASRDRTRAGHNVAPQGLYFVEAGYRPWDEAASERYAQELLR
ncbi:MAG TPA: tRNA pseudouridine(38-40) synthase TruA [Trueperaceae bacterium]|nr:tRNA pseudouridine(38-40) synthase TruA [Trueperaceae bacterium]